MDPALLNYLQSQNAFDKDAIKMPVQQEYNPFDHGIKRAVQTARESLGMNENQQNLAIRNALSGFSNGLRQHPPAEGLWGKVAMVASALGPAVNAYDATEEASINQNNQLASQILAMQAAEQERRAREEERAWHRNIAERQFAETLRAHQAAEAYRNEALNNKFNKYKTSVEIDKIAPQIRTDSAFDRIGKQTEGSAAFLEEVEKIQEAYDRLEKSMQEAGINTANPLAWQNGIRRVSGIFSSFNGDPKLREVAKNYDILQSVTTNARLTAEANKKKGALTDFTVKYADEQNIYPNLKKDNYDIFIAKLQKMREEAQNGYDASNLALTTGRYINRKNFEKAKELLEPQVEPELSGEPELAPGGNGANEPYLNTAPNASGDDDLGIEWEGN